MSIDATGSGTVLSPVEDSVTEVVIVDETGTTVLHVLGEDVDLIETGQEGPPGAPGAAGATYVHVQEIPAASWTIDHGLGRAVVPAILLDSEPVMLVWTDVEVLDLNTIVLIFPQPESGRAYL